MQSLKTLFVLFIYFSISSFSFATKSKNELLEVDYTEIRKLFENQGNPQQNVEHAELLKIADRQNKANSGFCRQMAKLMLIEKIERDYSNSEENTEQEAFQLKEREEMVNFDSTFVVYPVIYATED